MRIPYDRLRDEFLRVFSKIGLPEKKAALCAKIFADNALDGVQSHSLNRMDFFVEYIRKGYVRIDTEPELLDAHGPFERWDGMLGPGMLTAWFSMERAIALAGEHGMGCAALRNGNHWMRGGTYGWQAADAGCIAVCLSNTIPNMPPWGSTERKIGNNPLVIAVPRKEGHIVLDMATSMFSYGQLQSHALRGEKLPFPGGFDVNGRVTDDPNEIMKTGKPLPAGYWKGSGLAVLIDLLTAVLSRGNATRDLLKPRDEHGPSQLFIAFDTERLCGTPFAERLVNEIVDFVHDAEPVDPDGRVFYPGERTLATRKENRELGVPVDEGMWKKLLEM